MLAVLLCALSLTPAAPQDAHSRLQQQLLSAVRMKFGRVTLRCRFHRDGSYWTQLDDQTRIRGNWWIDRAGRLHLHDIISRDVITITTYVVVMDRRGRGKVVDTNGADYLLGLRIVLLDR